MIYKAKKISISGETHSLEIGKDEVAAITIDSTEKTIEIKFENDKKIRLIPMIGTIEFILEDIISPYTPSKQLQGQM